MSRTCPETVSCRFPPIFSDRSDGPCQHGFLFDRDEMSVDKPILRWYDSSIVPNKYTFLLLTYDSDRTPSRSFVCFLYNFLTLISVDNSDQLSASITVKPECAAPSQATAPLETDAVSRKTGESMNLTAKTGHAPYMYRICIIQSAGDRLFAEKAV